MMNDTGSEIPLALADRSSLLRARTAALAELRQAATPRRWQTEALHLMAWLLGMTAVAILVALATTLFTPGRLQDRLGMAGLLLLAQTAAVWAAICPRHPRLRALAIGMAVAGAGGAVLLRGTGMTAPDARGWLCSVSHLAVGLAPLAATLIFLRRAAYHRGRALSGGLAVGTLGLLMGDLTCQRGWEHVVVHHLGAWAVLTMACLMLARWIRPHTFAP